MSEEKEFSKDTVDQIAKLALLDLKDEEKEKLAEQLNDILSYFKKLNDLDTSDIKPTIHPIVGLENVFREDVPRDCLTNEEAIKNAQHKKEGYFKAPRILKE